MPVPLIAGHRLHSNMIIPKLELGRQALLRTQGMLAAIMKRLNVPSSTSEGDWWALSNDTTLSSYPSDITAVYFLYTYCCVVPYMPVMQSATAWMRDRPDLL